MKINSVKIDRDVYQAVFIDRDIEPSIAETKFPNPDDFEGQSIYKASITALKRTIRRQMPETAGAKKDYLEKCGVAGSLEFLKLGHPNWERIERLVKYLTKTKESLTLTPVLVLETKQYDVSYIPVHLTIKPDKHGNSWVAKNRKDDSRSLRFLDFVTLAAENLLAKEIRAFAAAHPGRVREAIFKSFIADGAFIPSMIEDISLRDVLTKRAEEERYEINTDSYMSRYFTRELSEVYNGNLEQLSQGHPNELNIIRLLLPEYLRYIGSLQTKAVDSSVERTEYAKAFDTKKNIPKKHQDVMQDNAFLDAHGYVELDGDVDLDKFDIIEDNFEQLRLLMPYPKDPTNSFRIKKLGNYRAAGIYFPSKNATIFDLNHPSSFVHELFHQLDYTYGKKSFAPDQDTVHETAAFRRVYDHYVMLVKRNIAAAPDNDAFKMQWNSKNKFNRDYYLKESEVFARLGELLIAVLGRYQENSLYKSIEELQSGSNSAVYPVDEKLMRLTHDYFRETFPFMKLQERNGSVA